MLDRFPSLRILVVGDLMLDHYVWGDVHRISPEAPVPIVLASHDTWTAGGAANVALNLKQLGTHTRVFGHLADDDAGQRLRTLLDQQGISLLEPSGPRDVPTIIKTRVMARGQQLCRIDREGPLSAYRPDAQGRWRAVLEGALSGTDAVLVSDYAKGWITQELLDDIVDACSSGKPLLTMDPKPSRHLSLRGCHLLTPNRSEALELAGIPPIHPADTYPLEEVCRRIHERHGPHRLVVTLGAEGMALCEGGHILETLPTAAREVFDVSGAGDTVIATLTAALAAGASLHDAAWLANQAAGCVVAHMGTVPIQRDELLATLRAG